MTIKRTVPFLIFLLLFAFNGIAQVSRNTFSVTGGYSLSIGEFASEHLDDPRAGLADDGYYGQVAYERRIAPWIGVRFSGSYNVNNTNTQPITDKANELVEMYRELIGEGGVYSWNNSASRWNLGSAMVGPVIYIHLGRVQVAGHVQAGRLFIKSPRVEVLGTSSSGNNPIQAQMHPIDTQTWGIGGGASLRIPVAKNVRFQLSADAMAGEANFEGIAIHGTVGGYQHTQLMDEKRSVGLINVGAGFVFDF